MATLLKVNIIELRPHPLSSPLQLFSVILLVQETTPLQTVFDDVVHDNLSEALLSGVEDKPLVKVEVSFDGRDTGLTKLYRMFGNWMEAS
jgi:hypothetical protein